MLLEGVYTAVVTPFTDDGKVDGAALEQLVEHIIAGGGEGIVALGTVGDGLFVDDGERADVLRIVRDAAAGRAGLVAGASATTTRDAIRHAQLAHELGYGCAMVAPPPYHLPSPSDLVAHFRAVERAADLPVLLYDYPMRVGVGIGFDVLDELAGDTGIIGVKEASGDMARIVEMRDRYEHRYEIVCGADSLIVDFALWGSRAWIAGASGFWPREHVQILADAAAGNYGDAQARLRPLLPMLLDMERGGYPQKVRSGLAYHGLPAGRTRLPMQPLDAGEERSFLTALEASAPATAPSR